MTELLQYRTCADAVAAAGDYLTKQLFESEGNIILLLAGGSCLNAVRHAVKKLDGPVLSRIHLAQIDERVVPLDDPASNWRQIEESVGARLNQFASTLPMVPNVEEADDLAISYEMRLMSLLETADETIGIYGIGDDGHIAGMLSTTNPGDFTQFLDGRLVVGYKAHDYTRITTTAALLTKLSEVILLTCGPNKVKTVDKINQDLAPHNHPAQLLKDASRVSLFVGEEQA